MDSPDGPTPHPRARFHPGGLTDGLTSRARSHLAQEFRLEELSLPWDEAALRPDPGRTDRGAAEPLFQTMISSVPGGLFETDPNRLDTRLPTHTASRV